MGANVRKALSINAFDVAEERNDEIAKGRKDATVTDSPRRLV